MSNEMRSHDLGVRAIGARYYREAVAWDWLIDAFRSRAAGQLTLNLPIALAKLLGHDDIGYYSDQIPAHVRGPAIAKVLTFGPDEIAKILSMLPDSDFERPSLGYSLMPLFGQRAESPQILSFIRDNETYRTRTRELAGYLVDYYRHDPDRWRFWRRDAIPEN